MTQYFYTANGNVEIIDTSDTSQALARVYPWHIHLHHWTAGRVASGAVWLTGADGIRRHCKSDIFFIPPKTPHQLVVEPGSALTVLSYSSSTGLARLASFFLTSENGEVPFPTGEGSRQLLFAACDTPAICEQNLAHQTDIMVKAVASIAARIAARPQTEFALAAMAENAGFSHWHFLRCFQAYVGMTPHALQTQCRLRLLRAGIRMGSDLASLAVSTGFTDQSHMHKLFKRYHCLTPKQFRQASFRLPL